MKNLLVWKISSKNTKLKYLICYHKIINLESKMNRTKKKSVIYHKIWVNDQRSKTNGIIKFFYYKIVSSNMILEIIVFLNI